jgi:carbon storage regulator
MLVLTRSANQSIVIGSDIVVTVLEVRGENVRIGISAPRSVAVYRNEVIAQLEAANRESLSPSAEALAKLKMFKPSNRSE